MSSIVLIVQLLLALSLIGIVLIQRTNQSGLGLGDSDGGGMAGLLTGRGTANFLTRTTALIGAGFLIACIVSAILGTTGARTGSGLQDLTIEREVNEDGSPAIPAGLTPAGATTAPTAGDDEPAVPSN